MYRWGLVPFMSSVDNLSPSDFFFRDCVLVVRCFSPTVITRLTGRFIIRVRLHTPTPRQVGLAGGLAPCRSPPCDPTTLAPITVSANGTRQGGRSTSLPRRARPFDPVPPPSDVLLACAQLSADPQHLRCPAVHAVGLDSGGTDARPDK